MSTITPTAPNEIGVDANSRPAADTLDPQIAALQAGGISLMETVEIALKSLTANKLRTLLTALGIIIGVGAVVALMAIGGDATGQGPEDRSAPTDLYRVGAAGFRADRQARR